MNPETGKKIFTPQRLKKDPAHTREIANIILQEDLDIIVLQEVERIKALSHFNINYLQNRYHGLVISGNDTRGIEIAFLIKRDLQLKYKFTTNKHVPLNANNDTPLFSRDLPTLHIWPNNTNSNAPPSLIIMGNHLKSQRNRKGDINSISFRTKQAEKISEITKNYEKFYPKTPIILAGDFNADITSSIEFKSLFQDELFKDAFDLIKAPLNKESRITHSYHPPGEKSKYNQLDGFLLNKASQSKIKKAKVYRYLDKIGNEKPIPSTRQQRDQNPSDHYPIIMEIQIQ